ncbi:50S ribosomal protein L18 [Candidatus Aerophobetes bacterium]|uniref:Large ribosomal subunit protein uL18 n=1 Tax=Aerophobetes bacterium TaxID=2030807 RepID=A0A2A4X8E8_UNCAE|nr:MAG: 50S ribosomal protein L18 [Candidatus Aerophobetes bacterium]
MKSKSKVKINKIRIKRTFRVRKHLKACASFKHRLCVTRSLKHISAQVINDKTGETVAAISTMSKKAGDLSRSKEGAAFVGKEIAVLAKEKGVEEVVFDRGANKYHGLVAALADAARENGLKF